MISISKASFFYYADLLSSVVLDGEIPKGVCMTEVKWIEKRSSEKKSETDCLKF